MKARTRRSNTRSKTRSALTEADVNAQSVIIGALTNSYGSHLNIVGEEDGDANARPKKDEQKLKECCFEFKKMDEVEDVEVRVGDRPGGRDPRVHRRTISQLSVFDWCRA